MFASLLPLLMFLTLLIFILLGFPVAFTIGGVAVFFALLGMATDLLDYNKLGFVPSKIFGIIENVNLIAVPLFAFMGIMLEKSGLAKDLLETSGKIFSKVKGGLFFSVIIVGTLLAASTGIIGATVVTMAVIALPTMIKQNYNKELACGLISASGTLGQIIPPSIILILLGMIMQVDVGSLFAAAFIPGLLLVFFYALYIFIRCLINPKLAPPVEINDGQELMKKQMFAAIFYPGLLVIFVLGSIIFGIATPTEAAACGAVGSILITILRKRFKNDYVKSATIETAKISAMVFTILICAQFFGVVFRELEGEHILLEFVATHELSGPSVILFLMIVMFILGFFLDFLEICFIIIPIVYPILINLELFGSSNLQEHLIWLSILIAINLQTSFLTPPFGFALFYLKGASPPEIKTSHIYKGVLPFIGIQILVLILVYIFPILTTWLPNYFFKNE